MAHYIWVYFKDIFRPLQLFYTVTPITVTTFLPTDKNFAICGQQTQERSLKLDPESQKSCFHKTILK